MDSTFFPDVRGTAASQGIEMYQQPGSGRMKQKLNIFFSMYCVAYGIFAM